MSFMSIAIRSKKNGPAMVDGKYKMKDGTIYASCNDYKDAMGDYAISGWYHDKSNPDSKMFCMMDTSDWDLPCDSAYELLLRRMTGSYNDFGSNTYE